LLAANLLHPHILELVRVDSREDADSDTETLVVYRPHKRYFFISRMYQHASLEVKPEAIRFLDRLIGGMCCINYLLALELTCIVSYILVERRRRARRMAYQRGERTASQPEEASYHHAVE
jgi:hypothetical protein